MATVTTPWLSPSTTLFDAGWTTPNNVFAQDGANAVRAVTGGAETPYFRVYGFNDAGTPLASLVSTWTSVDGFEFQFYGRTSAAKDYAYVFIGNAPAGSPQNANGFEKSIDMPVSASTSGFGAILGGPADLMGGKQGGGAFAVSDLDANWGLSGAWAGTLTVTWDYVRMRITGTAPGGGGASPYKSFFGNAAQGW